jgi:hypothetical protein
MGDMLCTLCMLKDCRSTDLDRVEECVMTMSRTIAILLQAGKFAGVSFVISGLLLRSAFLFLFRILVKWIRSMCE